MRLTPTQQAILSLLAQHRRDGQPYPSAAVISRNLGIVDSYVPRVLMRLERLGALTLSPMGRSLADRSYARRLTLLWDDERIALGGAEQLSLWRKA